MKRNIPFLVLFILQSISVAGPTVRQEPSRMVADLGNGVQLEFARHDDLLLGLHKASVNGIALTSTATVQRPVIAQEWEKDRMICPFLRSEERGRVRGD